MIFGAARESGVDPVRSHLTVQQLQQRRALPKSLVSFGGIRSGSDTFVHFSRSTLVLATYFQHVLFRPLFLAGRGFRDRPALVSFTISFDRTRDTNFRTTQEPTSATRPSLRGREATPGANPSDGGSHRSSTPCFQCSWRAGTRGALRGVRNESGSKDQKMSAPRHLLDSRDVLSRTGEWTV